MKSARAIEIDFSQAQKKAEELDDIAREMRQLANSDLSDSLQELSAVWRGEAANVYQKKGSHLKERILVSAKEIEKAAATIRKTAQNTYNAEMRAYQLTQERLYHS